MLILNKVQDLETAQISASLSENTFHILFLYAWLTSQVLISAEGDSELR